MPANILLVEDEPAIQELIAANLARAGHHVVRANDAESAQRIVREALPDLVLLDWMLPGASGVEFARRLRADERTSDIPIIMLTARGEEQDKVTALEIGADDYVTKPFNPRELLVRARNLLWRVAQCTGSETREAEQGCFRFEGWTLNPHKRQLVSPDGRIERLPQGEFKLLMALLSHAGQVLSRDQLMDAIHDREWTPNDRTVDVLVGRVRRKLDDNPADPRLILTAHGAGYLFAGELD